MPRNKLERYFNRLWYTDRTPGAGWRGLSGAYRVATARRAHRPLQQPPCPVIVVGNLTVGGGGKTPVTAALAELLRDEGMQVGIISRGYGAPEQRSPVRVEAGSDPGAYGDEPVALARRSGCPVWVCRHRKVALDAAIAAGADVVVADDGLQHQALPRSFEICVVDGARGFGNGRLLPAGPLRQPLSRLDEVDLVLVKQAGAASPGRNLPGQAFAMVPGECYRLVGGAAAPVSHLAGVTLDAVCGIANPESFFTTLEAAGLSIRRHAFPDHHAFSAAELQALPGPLIVTEKDAVKLERLDDLTETWVLPVEARIPAAAAEQILAHVREFGSNA